MSNDVDKLYNNDQNAYSISTNQSIYSNVPGSNFDPLSADEHIDQTLYGGKNSKKLASAKIKKRTTLITTLAAAVVASSIGVISVVNPLLSRPKVTNGHYQIVGNKLNYSFTYSATKNYNSSLLLYCNGEKYEEIAFENKSKIEGNFTLYDMGDYHLDIYSTNGVDFKKQTVLYTFFYK